MKLVVLVSLLLIGITYAQLDDTEIKLVQCEKNCCNNSGVWNDTKAQCEITNSSYNYEYSKCSNKCYENATKELQNISGRPSFCCAPALILGLVFFMGVYKK